MKIALFSHDANPSVDRPFLHKSTTYIGELIARKEAVMLPADAYHRPAAQCRSPKAAQEGIGDLNAVSAPESLATNSAISAKESEANAGIGTFYEVLVGKAKAKAWMSEKTADERNPLPRGKWADMSQLQVVAVQ